MIQNLNDVVFPCLALKMAFMYSPAHNHTVSFCFVEMPKIEMEVEAAVLNNKSNFVSRVLPKLIVFAVHTVIRTKLTLPFMKTKWLINKPEQPPYPWQVDDQQKLYDWKPKKVHFLLFLSFQKETKVETQNKQIIQINFVGW